MKCLKDIAKIILLMFMVFVCCPIIYAGRTGLTRQEARQASRIALARSARQVSPEPFCFIPVGLDLTKNRMAALLAVGMFAQVAFAGPLDGKLTPIAQKVQQLRQLAQEYPNAAQAVTVTGHLAVDCGIGAVVGLPAGPAGALAGCGVGTLAGAAEELTGAGVGKVIDTFAGDKVSWLVDEGAAIGAKGFMALDSSLSKPLATDLALGGAQAVAMVTGVLPGTKVLNKASVKETVQSALTKLKDTPLKSMHNAFKEGLGNEFTNSFYASQAPLFASMPSGFQVSTSMPGKSFERSTVEHSDFLGQGQKLMQHQAYLEWKEQSSGPLHLPRIEPFDGHLNKFSGAALSPSDPGVQRADMAALNERIMQANLAKMSALPPAVMYLPMSQDLEDCLNLASTISDNKEFFSQVVVRAQKNKAFIGEMHFPVIPNLSRRCFDRWLTFDKTKGEVARINQAVSAEYRGFLDEFDKQIHEYNRRINELRNYKEAHEIIAAIKGFLATVDNPRDYVKKALAVFAKKTSAEFLSQPSADIEKALGSVLYVKSALDSAHESREFIDSRVVGVDRHTMGENFLDLFRSNDRALVVARSVLISLANSKFDATIKKQARDLYAQQRKGNITVPDFAHSLAALLSHALVTHGDYDYMFSELNELGCGFVMHGIMQPMSYKQRKHFGKKSAQDRQKEMLDFLAETESTVVCTPKGTCGIVNFWIEAISVTKGDMEKEDAWFKHQYPLATAQDLLGFIQPRGSYIGDHFVGEVPEGAAAQTVVVRSLDGGHREARAIFKFFAEGQVIKDGYNARVGAPFQKIVLSDKTKITFSPLSKDGETVITISDMPSWISSDIIQLRFPPQKEVVSASVVKELEVKKKALLEELFHEFEKLSEEEQGKLMAVYDEMVSAEKEVE